MESHFNFILMSHVGNVKKKKITSTIVRAKINLSKIGYTAVVIGLINTLHQL